MTFRDLVESVRVNGSKISTPDGFSHEIDPEVMKEFVWMFFSEVAGRVQYFGIAELVTAGLNYEANGIDSYSVSASYTRMVDGGREGPYEEPDRDGVPEWHRITVRMSDYLMRVHPGITVDMYVGEMSGGYYSSVSKQILMRNPNLSAELKLLLEIK
jgi:hypothetical protein